jgi:cytochrome c2
MPDSERYNMTIWINGDSCDSLNALDDETCTDTILQALWKLVPSAQAVTSVGQLVRWTNDPFAGGSWALWGPGQAGSAHAAIRAPAWSTVLCRRTHRRGLPRHGGGHGVRRAGRVGNHASANVTRSIHRIAVMLSVTYLAIPTVKSEPLSGKQLYDIACEACHSLGSAPDHRVGPPLGNLLDRKAAAIEGYRYSEALRASEWVWTLPHFARLAL